LVSRNADNWVATQPACREGSRSISLGEHREPMLREVVIKSERAPYMDALRDGKANRIGVGVAIGHICPQDAPGLRLGLLDRSERS